MSTSKRHEDDRREPGNERTPGTDVSQIELDEVESGTFPASLEGEYRVVITRQAFTTISEHAASDTSVELCGVLAGRLSKDQNGPFLLVEQAVSGVATRRTGSQVTFTHETWQQIHGDMESRFPDLRIVGWYHTHPGFGIFLSDMDQFIQDNFFNLPHHVAFVFDPISNQRGLFIWQNGRSTRLRRYWLADELCYDLEAEQSLAAEQLKTQPEQPVVRRHEDEEPAHEREAEARSGSEPHTGPSLAWLLIVGVLILLAFWLGSNSSRLISERSRQESDAVQSLIRTGLFRDGLRQQLSTVQMRLNQAHRDLDRLAASPGPDLKSSSSSSSTDIERAATIAELGRTISEAHNELNRIIRAYSEADRLASRMRTVSQLPEEVQLLRTEQLILRRSLAQVLGTQAKLLRAPAGQNEQERQRLADELLAIAAGLDPQLFERNPQIDPDSNSASAAPGDE